MKTQNELEKIYRKVSRSGRDEIVRAALEALLLAPEDVDLQINVIGASHRANWLPTRKAILLRTLPFGSEQWVSRCISRIIATEAAADALYALLGCGVTEVAATVCGYSPDLVQVWDVNGAENCGIGLSQHQGKRFRHYFYIGWAVGTGDVTRLDYASSIYAPPGHGDKRLDKIEGLCETSGGIWAELPYGFGSWPNYKEFIIPDRYFQPYGFTEAVRRQLGDSS